MIGDEILMKRAGQAVRLLHRLLYPNRTSSCSETGSLACRFRADSKTTLSRVADREIKDSMGRLKSRLRDT